MDENKYIMENERVSISTTLVPRQTINIGNFHIDQNFRSSLLDVST